MGSKAAGKKIAISLKLEIADSGRLGRGKIELLELIEQHGSISAAGRAMGMSYRKAWILVDTMNRMFSMPAVVGQIGGTAGGGAKLTPLGLQIIALYRRCQQLTASAIQQELEILKKLMA